MRPDRQPEKGQHVFDLGTLVELHSSDDRVRDVGPEQLFFERPRLRVGAEEHGEVLERVLR